MTLKGSSLSSNAQSSSSQSSQSSSSQSSQSSSSQSSQSSLSSSQQSLSNPDSYPTIIHRHAYGPRYRVGIEFTGQGRTKQSFKDECDINVIMSRYQVTGVLEHTREALPQFLDVTELPDYQSAMDTIATARGLFSSLPSAIRDRFDNDPRKLLEWVHDPENLGEAVTLGFLSEASLKAYKQPDGTYRASQLTNPQPNLTPEPKAEAKPA